MNLDKKYQIEKACSTDETRYILNNAFFSLTDHEGKKSPILVATDGRVMAIVPCIDTDPADTEGLVSPAALKAQRKAKPLGDLLLTPENESVPSAGLTLKRKEGCFPNWRNGLPKKDRPVQFQVRLNPALLLRLAQALGQHEKDGETAAPSFVTLTFSDPMEPILVESADAWGICMPATGRAAPSRFGAMPAKTEEVI